MALQYEVLLDGKVVFERVVAFDLDAGWVDHYQTDDIGSIAIVDDMPVVTRRTGNVSVDWHDEGPTAANAVSIPPAAHS